MQKYLVILSVMSALMAAESVSASVGLSRCDSAIEIWNSDRSLKAEVLKLGDQVQLIVSDHFRLGTNTPLSDSSRNWVSIDSVSWVKKQNEEYLQVEATTFFNKRSVKEMSTAFLTDWANSDYCGPQALDQHPRPRTPLAPCRRICQ